MMLDSTLFARPWEIPELTSMNRLRARADLIPYATEAAARSRNPDRSPWFISLDGEWAFSYHDRPDEVTPAEIAASTNTQNWSRIQVPGDFCTQGYPCQPHYVNVQMPFKNDIPRVPDENPCGVYRTTFSIPNTWEKRRIVLHIGSAESVAWVYLNGQLIGMSSDSRLPSEYDLTGLAQVGTNELAILCIRWSANSYVEDQDHWREAGIHRSVYLYSQNRLYLEDAKVDAGYDVAEKAGTFFAKVKVNFQTEPDEGDNYTVEAQLYDAQKKAVFESPLSCTQGQDFRDNLGIVTLSTRIPGAAPWSAEVPNLYLLTLTLKDKKGKAVEHTAIRIGFRDIRIENRQLLVNGAPVMIRGVNRHEFDPIHCKYVPLETSIRDIELLKRFNFNAVRSCHYPDDTSWLELCDEYGIYLVDEANIECHDNYSTLAHSSTWQHAFQERGMRMVLRDKNHPCVILWSLGNESGIGENHLYLADWIRAYDPTRPIHYEGAMRERWAQRGGLFNSKINPRLTDIINPMYEPIENIARYVTEVEDNRPFILCEYSHAMGNSCGSLGDYWKLFYEKHGAQGGFIWDWVEQGMLKYDAEGKPFWAYGGDYGEKRNDTNFCCNGMVNPDRTPKPQTWDFKKIVQPVRIEAKNLTKGLVTFTNLDHFQNTADWLSATWSLEVEGNLLAKGSLPTLDVPPQKSVTLKLQGFDFAALPKIAAEEEAFLFISVNTHSNLKWTKKGHQVAWQQLPIQLKVDQKRQLEDPELLVDSEDAPALLEAAQNGAPKLLQAGDVSLAFDPETGDITHYQYKGHDLLLKGPSANFWRTPVDNEGSRPRGVVERSNQWKAFGRWCTAGFDEMTEELEFFMGGEMIEEGCWHFDRISKITPKNLQASIRLTTAYEFHPNGALHCQHRFEIPEEIQDLPRIGVRLTLPKSQENLTWFGLGPLESYPDRKESAFVGRFNSSVTEQYVPYIVPQEHGHHLDTRWLTLTDSNDQGIQFQADDACFGFNATHLPPEVLEQALHINELNPQEEVTLFLDAAIRGLGTGSCGPDTRPEYRIKPGTYELNYWMFPV